MEPRRFRQSMNISEEVVNGDDDDDDVGQIDWSFANSSKSVFPPVLEPTYVIPSRGPRPQEPLLATEESIRPQIEPVYVKPMRPTEEPLYPVEFPSEPDEQIHANINHRPESRRPIGRRSRMPRQQRQQQEVIYEKPKPKVNEKIYTEGDYISRVDEPIYGRPRHNIEPGRIHDAPYNTPHDTRQPHLSSGSTDAVSLNIEALVAPPPPSTFKINRSAQLSIRTANLIERATARPPKLTDILTEDEEQTNGLGNADDSVSSTDQLQSDVAKDYNAVIPPVRNQSSGPPAIPPPDPPSSSSGEDDDEEIDLHATSRDTLDSDILPQSPRSTKLTQHLTGNVFGSAGSNVQPKTKAFRRGSAGNTLPRNLLISGTPSILEHSILPKVEMQVDMTNSTRDGSQSQWSTLSSEGSLGPSIPCASNFADVNISPWATARGQGGITLKDIGGMTRVSVFDISVPISSQTGKDLSVAPLSTTDEQQLHGGGYDSVGHCSDDSKGSTQASDSSLEPPIVSTTVDDFKVSPYTSERSRHTQKVVLDTHCFPPPTPTPSINDLMIAPWPRQPNLATGSDEVLPEGGILSPNSPTSVLYPLIPDQNMSSDNQTVTRTGSDAGDESYLQLILMKLERKASAHTKRNMRRQISADTMIKRDRMAEKVLSRLLDLTAIVHNEFQKAVIGSAIADEQDEEFCQAVESAHYVLDRSTSIAEVLFQAQEIVDDARCLIKNFSRLVRAILHARIYENIGAQHNGLALYMAFMDMSSSLQVNLETVINTGSLLSETTVPFEWMLTAEISELPKLGQSQPVIVPSGGPFTLKCSEGSKLLLQFPFDVERCPLAVRLRVLDSSSTSSTAMSPVVEILASIVDEDMSAAKFERTMSKPLIFYIPHDEMSNSESLTSGTLPPRILWSAGERQNWEFGTNTQFVASVKHEHLESSYFAVAISRFGRYLVDSIEMDYLATASAI